MQPLPDAAPPAAAPPPDATDVEFVLGEDAPRNCDGRSRQEAAWATTNVDARQHFSMREALSMQKPAIQVALLDYERVRTMVGGMGSSAVPKLSSSLLSKLSPELLEPIVEHAMPGSVPLVHHHCHQPVATTARAPLFRVFARVRPLNERECTAGEYAAVDTTQQTLSCHKPTLARTGRRLSLLHRSFACDRVFGSLASEEQVCDGVLRPLLERVTSGLGDATVILYGQTGAGKTHSLSSMISRCEAALDARGSGGEVTATATATATATVTVTFYEVATSGCCDLLNSRAKINLRSDENEVLHALLCCMPLYARGTCPQPARCSLLAYYLLRLRLCSTRAAPHAISCDLMRSQPSRTLSRHRIRS